MVLCVLLTSSAHDEGEGDPPRRVVTKVRALDNKSGAAEDRAPQDLKRAETKTKTKSARARGSQRLRCESPRQLELKCLKEEKKIDRGEGRASAEVRAQHQPQSLPKFG
jgi:hypothetical protein